MTIEILRVASRDCRICNTKEHEKTIADIIIRHLPENRVFGGLLRIVECTNCGMRYLNPMPHQDALPLIYNYQVYCDSTNNNEVLQKQFHQKLKEYAPDAKEILEVGCGTGEFMAYLEALGYRVSGVEFADSSRKVKFKGHLYEGRIEDVHLPEQQYDVVYLLNVLEHIEDAQSVLKKIRTTVKEGGVLIIRHPNSDLFFNTGYKYLLEYPKYFISRVMQAVGIKPKFTIVGFQNQHLNYFNYKTMRKLLDMCGYTVESCTTKDVYNEYRMINSFEDKRYIELAIAFTRSILSKVHLGPECLFVARKRTGR